MEEKSEGVTLVLFREHARVLGRVAMALVGDAVHAERVLEQAAREAAGKSPPSGVKPLAWLLGFVRVASTTHLSKLPLRTRNMVPEKENAPSTERLGASEAIPARAALAALKPTEREAVVLCLVGNLEAADVAIACNTDVATAKARIARGLEQLVVAPGNKNDGGPR